MHRKNYKPGLIQYLTRVYADSFNLCELRELVVPGNLLI